MSAVFQAKIKTGGKMRTMVLQAEDENDARKKFSEIDGSENSGQLGLELIDVELFKG